MSQEKVDQHKADKKNRKKLNRQAHLRRLAGYLCAVLVALLLFGWVGYSVYSKVNQANSADEQIDMDALIDYLNSMQTDTDAGSDSSADDSADAAADTEAE